nr:hypothetical protein CFP56_46842 [Quercus suber]POE87639.1 hypothetical protein CFP56_30228 [Quercus suber]
MVVYGFVADGDRYVSLPVPVLVRIRTSQGYYIVSQITANQIGTMSARSWKKPIDLEKEAPGGDLCDSWPMQLVRIWILLCRKINASPMR